MEAPGSSNLPVGLFRLINIALGAWLFISAFLWPHTYASMTNAWIVGLLCTTFALAATWYSPFRFANTALAIWLFISSWVLPHASTATIWNNVILSVAIFLASVSTLPRSRTTTFVRP